ncbi:nucleic acid dioxygenase ALKBH1 [Topomyia yanbarensis]|uniref:nucleic acid dioxygenase ALKBH1 n=1 Tax=Topomyia yanbarensis TaxID=2498891 RepID=UPI00273C0C64|nr:nucleic acid dioxygenase ALKBH1 [Topomyia yanbarensis]
MFDQAFKFYKARNPPPSFENVIDLCKHDGNGLDSRLKDISSSIAQNVSFPGIINSSSWRVFELVGRPGLLFISNPFTKRAQRYWIRRSLCDYPQTPNRTNIPNSVFEKYSDGHETQFDWWNVAQSIEEPTERNKFLKSLRWTTLGYHYDWTNKVYDDAARAEFPADLASMCHHFAAVLGFQQFHPQAAIVNYYPVGSTLAGHTDHSERNLEAPLFSFSFGQPAVFLIGGPSKDERPDALLLRSGDVIVMTRASRLCYHAVPRVFPDSAELVQQLWAEEQEQQEGQSSLGGPEVQTIVCSSSPISTTAVWNDCRSTGSSQRHHFVDYISNSRININIRQVLNEGENHL